MVDVYLAEKPRAKEWFPDHIPGLYRLSKGEVLDDIDYIQSNLAGDGGPGSRIKRRNKPQGDDERAAKKSRLTQKIKEGEADITEIKGNYAQLRRTLDTNRAQMVQYRDLIAQTKRELQAVADDRKNMEEKLLSVREDLVQSARKSAQSKSEYEISIQQLKELLHTENNLTAAAAGRLGELQELRKEFEKRDDRIAELECELSNKHRQIQMMEDVLKAKSDSESPETTQMLDVVRSNTQRLEAFERQLNERSSALAERERKQEDQLKQMNAKVQELTEANKKLTAAKQEADKTMETNQEREKEFEANLKESKKFLAKQRMQIEHQEEREKSFESILEIAKVRAEDAEENVRELVDEVQILRSGNKLLQTAFNKLMIEYLDVSAAAAKPAAAEAMADLKEEHAKAAVANAALLAKASINLQNNSAAVVRSEVAALQDELKSANEAADSSSNQVKDLRSQLEDVRRELHKLQAARRDTKEEDTEMGDGSQNKGGNNDNDNDNDEDDQDNNSDNNNDDDQEEENDEDDQDNDNDNEEGTSEDRFKTVNTNAPVDGEANGAVSALLNIDTDALR